MTDKRYGRFVLVAAMLVATGIAGTGYAAAAPARTTLNYTCDYGQAMQADVTWNGPATVPVGKATPTITVNALATLGSLVTEYLNFAGMATIAGTVNAPGSVAAPEGNIPSALQLTVPRTQVPASGALTVPANGVTPPLVFHRAGQATISVGNTLAMHFDTWDANGNSKGEYDLSCTLDSGSSAIVYQVDITAPPVAPPTTTTPNRTSAAGVPAATAPATTTAPNSTGSAPSSMVVIGGPQSTATSTLGGAAAKTKTGKLAATPTAFWGSSPARSDWRLAAGAIPAVGMSLVAGGWWLTRRRARR